MSSSSKNINNLGQKLLAAVAFTFPCKSLPCLLAEKI